VGGFFAGQWTVDLGYGPHLGPDPLSGYCLAGPGGCEGLSLCFKARTWSYQEINAAFLTLHAHQRECFELVVGKSPPRLYGRLAFPMDIQNFACEMQKFLQRTAKEYHGGAGKQEPPFKPPWWDETDWEARERQLWIQEHEERKKDGRIAATKILGRLKEEV
jgi:hypothetical protein